MNYNDISASVNNVKVTSKHIILLLIKNRKDFNHNTAILFNGNEFLVVNNMKYMPLWPF